jgi:hypothetical protein
MCSVFRVFWKPLLLTVENTKLVTLACCYLHNSRTLDCEREDGTFVPSHKETQVPCIFRDLLEDRTEVRRPSEISLERILQPEKGAYHSKKITFSYGLFEMWNKTKDLNVEVVLN